MGALLNQVKDEIEMRIAEAMAALRAEERARRADERIDVSEPGRGPVLGRLHPLTRTMDEMVDVFRSLGFSVAEGPEIEDDYHNFEALNFPRDHPARDMQDTLFVGGDLVLRTHTSPVQIRVMEAYRPPIRVTIPGRCYRRDPFDASHAPVFTQVEGLCVDEGISFVDLKAAITFFLRRFFAAGVKVRFRPSFFPFTEPSAEVDVECQLCHGAGCPACKGTGWMEILGCGMVDPNVFENVGIDPERYTGWAFGMGLDRAAMLRYGIPDIRLLFDADMRFHRQFVDGA